MKRHASISLFILTATLIGMSSANCAAKGIAKASMSKRTHPIAKTQTIKKAVYLTQPLYVTKPHYLTKPHYVTKPHYITKPHYVTQKATVIVRKRRSNRFGR